MLLLYAPQSKIGFCCCLLVLLFFQLSRKKELEEKLNNLAADIPNTSSHLSVSSIYIYVIDKMNIVLNLKRHYFLE